MEVTAVGLTSMRVSCSGHITGPLQAHLSISRVLSHLGTLLPCEVTSQGQQVRMEPFLCPHQLATLVSRSLSCHVFT